MNAQKLQSSVECAGQFELLVKDSDYQIGGHCDPYLGLHGVGTGAVVMLDPQVPLDPPEEQLDAPPHLVKHGHDKGRDLQIVGQEDEFLCGFRVVKFDPSQKNRERLPRFFESRFSYMVAAQASEPVHRHGIMPGEFQVALCPRNKESSGVCYQNEPFEVHICPVHQIESPRLEEEVVQPANVVLPGACNMDAGRNRSAQVDLGMDLDTRLGLTEVGPWKQSQREIDSGRIQCIDRVVQVQPEIFFGIEWPGLAHQAFGELLPDTPVPQIVRIGKSGFGDRFAEPKMIENFAPGIETGRDVSQTFSRGHLCEHHADQLLPKSEVTHSGFLFVALDDAVERLSVNKIENLGQYKAAGVHGPEASQMRPQSSNASHAFLLPIDSLAMLSKQENSI